MNGSGPFRDASMLELSYHMRPAAFVKVEIELEDRASEFGRVVEKA
jgi:hypothetical protein